MMAIIMSHESFNRCIWDRVHKTAFVGLQTLRIGVLYAVICFNDVSAAIFNVLEVLGMGTGDNMAKALAAIDRL
jgi:hypothetical protein